MICENQYYIFLPLCLNNNLLNHIKQKRLSHAGNSINFRSDYNIRLPQSVRYASVCTVQSAGEAQSSAAGYQAGTCQNRPLLRRRQLSSFRATYQHFGEWDPTFAKSTKRLHTSPPEHTTVWSRVKVHSIWVPLTFPENNII